MPAPHAHLRPWCPTCKVSTSPSTPPPTRLPVGPAGSSTGTGADLASVPLDLDAMNLPDFLLARIAEDEEVAWAGVSNQEDEGWSLVAVEATGRVVLSPHVGIIHERVQGEHIERWDPWRVLAECEAKRRIVKEFASEVARGPAGTRRDLVARQEGIVDAYRVACRLLAQPYATNPDFDPAWAV